METEIYLDWNGKTKIEMKKLGKRWHIGSGDVGYVWASLGMKNENALLHVLFPDEYWNNETGEPIRYVFTKEKYEKLVKAGIVYLIAALSGEEKGIGCDKESSEIGKTVLLSKMKSEAMRAVMLESFNVRNAIIWINSVWDFFKLGLQKEYEGLEPKIYIPGDFKNFFPFYSIYESYKGT